MLIIICISSNCGSNTGINLLHDVFDFVLFTVQDDASLLTDLQVLKNRSVLKTIFNTKFFHVCNLACCLFLLCFFLKGNSHYAFDTVYLLYTV